MSPLRDSASIVQSNAAPEDALSVRLFGDAIATFQGDAVKLAGYPKAMPLLAYLLLHHDAPVSRKRVAFALWPDEPEEVALANLRRYLHALKSALPGTPARSPWILIDAAVVQWNPLARCRVDVHAFERLVRAGRLAEAVDLQRGGLLEDYEDEWIEAHRERLRAAQLECLTRLMEVYRVRGDLTRAVNCGRRALELEPWREDLLRHLVTLRYQCGDRAGAIVDYRRFTERLRRELGVEPMPETAASYEAIIRQRPLAGLFSTS